MLTGLAWRNLRRDPLRTALTMLATAVATFAFVLLQTAVTSWDNQATGQSSLVLSRQRVSFLMLMPARLVEEIRAFPEVAASTPMLFFGGRIEGRENEDFLGLAVEPTSFLEVYGRDITLPDADRECWLRERDGLVLGQKAATTLGYKRGDKLSLQSGFAGTERPVPFQICGIYTARPGADDESAFFRLAYVNELLPTSRRDAVTLFVTRLKPGVRTDVATKKIDDHFDTTENPTLTQDEATFAKGFLKFLRTVLSAIRIIDGILLGLITLVVGNAISMSVRERTSEYGTLRALGFRPSSIFATITFEAMLTCLGGALLGGVGAFVLVNTFLGPTIESGSNGMFTSFRVTPLSLAVVLAATSALGFLAATPPALKTLRIRTIDALRSIG